MARQPTWETEDGIVKFTNLVITTANAVGSVLTLDLPISGPCSTLGALTGDDAFTYALSDANYDYCPRGCISITN